MKTKKLITIKSDVLEDIKFLARATGISANECISDILTAYVRSEEVRISNIKEYMALTAQ